MVRLRDPPARRRPQRARLRDVRAPAWRPAGRRAERLQGDLRLRHRRGRLGPARHGLELREGAHDLLPRIVEARLEVLDLRIALDTPQLEARGPLLEGRIAGWRAAEWQRPACGAVLGRVVGHWRRVG